jgi:diguanylate cyclase (GGDEF)-like protein
MVGIAVAGVTLYVAIRAMLNGYRPARFFLLAWSALLVFIALGALRNFGLVPTNFWTLNGLHVGLALDVLLLSCALADRVNLLKQEAEMARAEARERERSMEQLRYMAQHDVLTGLPNRASMQQRLELAVEIARRGGRKLAVMVADLDGFKPVNDRLGHAAGDHVLVAVAGRLRAAVRASDTVARLGGDEFVVLAGDLDDPGDAGRIAGKVCDAVRAPLPFEGEPLQVGCSLGISLFPDDATTPQALLELADRAMYAAKAQAGRRYAFFAAGQAVRAEPARERGLGS